jgi:hypothetical protein
MGAYIAAADAIRAAFDCVVVIVHHCGVEGGRPRGHTSLTGACDAQIAVERDKDGIITCRVEYMKDDEPSPPMTSKLQPVPLGTNSKGDPITSCVVIKAEGVAAEPRKREPKLPAKAQAALKALNEVLFDKGKPAPKPVFSEEGRPYIPNQVPCVTLDQWREYLIKRDVINPKGSHREEFRRLHTTLKNAGKINIWDDFVWVVQ